MGIVPGFGWKNKKKPNAGRPINMEDMDENIPEDVRKEIEERIKSENAVEEVKEGGAEREPGVEVDLKD
jgi:hypothetical protein